MYAIFCANLQKYPKLNSDNKTKFTKRKGEETVGHSEKPLRVNQSKSGILVSEKKNTKHLQIVSVPVSIQPLYFTVNTHSCGRQFLINHQNHYTTIFPPYWQHTQVQLHSHENMCTFFMEQPTNTRTRIN